MRRRPHNNSRRVERLQIDLPRRQSVLNVHVKTRIARDDVGVPMFEIEDAAETMMANAGDQDRGNGHQGHGMAANREFRCPLTSMELMAWS